MEIAKGHRFHVLDLLLRFRVDCSAIAAVTTGDGAVGEQQKDGVDHGHDHAVNVQSGDRRGTKHGEQVAAGDRANNPKHDVEDQTFAGLVGDFLLAANPAIKPRISQPMMDMIEVTSMTAARIAPHLAAVIELADNPACDLHPVLHGE